MCGENEGEQREHLAFGGSSPRVRGKLLATSLGTKSAGLIPACAGKTCLPAARARPRRAHPRVCGENIPAVIAGCSFAGSSPRVRGKRRVLILAAGASGLIPACAGKTRCFPWRHLRPWAHPRVCGENARVNQVNLRREGSSPRVRGKRAAQQKTPDLQRLIPACAGKTLPLPWTISAVPAHPRVCGENALAAGKASAAYGSSPRVRGKLAMFLGSFSIGGLIPACAGKTSCRW